MFNKKGWKYNFGVDEEWTVAFSRNVENKESCHAALKYCQKNVGNREKEVVLGKDW